MKICKVLLTALFIALFVISGDKVTAANTNKPAGLKSNIKVTFLEIGSVNCTPCRMMRPVMKEIEEKYRGKVTVVFYDVSGTMGSMVARQYGVSMIPTQVFLDDQRKEFFRHTGFYPASEIAKIIDKKLGKNAGNI
ncbi:MAG: thioredoxin family protein [Candidatus Margulisiibacteriota bacterium]